MPPRAAASSTAAWMAAVSNVTPSPTAPCSVTSTTPPRPPPGPPGLPGAGEAAAPAADGKAALAPAPPTSAAADISRRRRGTPGPDGWPWGLSEESLAARFRTVARSPVPPVPDNHPQTGLTRANSSPGAKGFRSRESKPIDDDAPRGSSLRARWTDEPALDTPSHEPRRRSRTPRRRPLPRVHVAGAEHAGRLLRRPHHVPAPPGAGDAARPDAHG